MWKTLPYKVDVVWSDGDLYSRTHSYTGTITVTDTAASTCGLTQIKPSTLNSMTVQVNQPPVVQSFEEFQDFRSLYFGNKDGLTECGARLYEFQFTDIRLNDMVVFDQALFEFKVEATTAD